MVQLAWISAFGLTKKVSGFRHFQVFGRLDFGIFKFLDVWISALY